MNGEGEAADGGGVEHEVTVIIPVRDDGVVYAGVGVEDVRAWGPTAFAAATDGTMWISDGVRRRVLAYDSKTGERTNTVYLEGVVEHIGAIAVGPGAVWVLDTSERAALVRVDRTSWEITTLPLPESLPRGPALTAMYLAGNGGLVVEAYGGSSRWQVLDASETPTEEVRVGWTIAGRRVEAFAGDPTGDYPGTGTLAVDGVTVATIDVSATLMGLRVLGEFGDGTFVVGMQEVALVDGKIQVDETIRKYDLGGNMLGEARASVDEEVVFIGQRVGVRADGEVYYAASRADHVEVQRLAFSETPLARILPASPLRIAPGGLDAGDRSHPRNDCVSAEDMLATAYEYASFMYSYSEANISGSCDNRTKPSWLKEAGKSYQGVAYDYGGNDSIADYAAKMAAGDQAGDIATLTDLSVAPCSRGVDCSGFLQRVWRWHLETKKNATHFHDGHPHLADLPADQQALLPGDALVDPGHHIMLFESWTPDKTAQVIDAAVVTDRVTVRPFPDWLDFDDYVPIRSSTRCAGGEPPPLPPNACSSGDITAVAVQDGTLHVAGTVAAPAGLLRYSLVVDNGPSPLHSQDYDEVPPPVADDFAVDLSLAGVAPGSYTLGLWVKDVDMCTGDAAVDQVVFEVPEGGPQCTPQADLACSGGDVYWYDSCGAIGAKQEECGSDAAVGGPYCVGDDIYQDYLEVGCSGDACTSQQTSTLEESCASGCSNGQCDDPPPCTDTYTVVTHECSDYSSAHGDGPGGGEIFSVCGTVDGSGYTTIKAHKNPENPSQTFGSRPYQVRVSDPSEVDDCGPGTPHFIVSDTNPSGIGGTTLTFDFQGIWEPDQTEKAYCVTASTKDGDIGYDPGDKSQESWWWSDKVIVTRECL